MGRVIGLLGGVGSGKSTVAGLMRERGLIVLDADAEARAVVETPEVLEALRDRFGPSITDERGALDRAELARLAFADSRSTADLNAIVHPAVRRRLLAGLAAAGDRPVVLDVPLLMESELAGQVDLWVFVEAAEERREERLSGRNWPPGERSRREALQAGLQQKRARADYTLENNGILDDLVRQVDALLSRIGVT
jgi:dephospho-CoA kinase